MKLENLFKPGKERKKKLMILALSVAIGVSIASLNLWNYTTSTNKYSLALNSSNKETLTVRPGENFESLFQLRNPREIQNLNIELKITGADPNLILDVNFNGEKLQNLRTFSNQTVRNFNLEGEDLNRVNKFSLTPDFSESSKLSFTISEITVTGYTSLQRTLFFFINLISIAIAIGPFLLIEYREHSLKKELEERFPDFLRDVVEGTRAGMALPQAIKNTKGNNYGRLTPYVEEMIAKIDWGLSFQKALSNFAEKSKSKIIRRASNTIIQTHSSGGDITEVLESVGNNLKEIKKLRSNKKTQLYGEMVTLYAVYFVFLGILVLLMKYLLPSLSTGVDVSSLYQGGQSMKMLIDTYRGMFTNLVIIQSIFSGLVIGQLTEGNLKSGGKHVAFLLLVGYSVAILLF